MSFQNDVYDFIVGILSVIFSNTLIMVLFFVSLAALIYALVNKDTRKRVNPIGAIFLFVGFLITIIPLLNPSLFKTPIDFWVTIIPGTFLLLIGLLHAPEDEDMWAIKEFWKAVKIAALVELVFMGIFWAIIVNAPKGVLANATILYSTEQSTSAQQLAEYPVIMTQILSVVFAPMLPILIGIVVVLAALSLGVTGNSGGAARVIIGGFLAFFIWAIWYYMLNQVTAGSFDIVNIFKSLLPS